MSWAAHAGPISFPKPLLDWAPGRTEAMDRRFGVTEADGWDDREVFSGFGWNVTQTHDLPPNTSGNDNPAALFSEMANGRD